LKIHGRESDATKVWDLLGVNQAEREKMEVEQDRETSVQRRAAQEAANMPNVEHIASNPRPQEKSVKDKLFDIFSEDVRARTALAVFLMGMQQLSGIDGVLYVSLLLHWVSVSV
jgi:DNA-directed RNA polymerase III subunit RPC2